MNARSPGTQKSVCKNANALLTVTHRRVLTLQLLSFYFVHAKMFLGYCHPPPNERYNSTFASRCILSTAATSNSDCKARC